MVSYGLKGVDGTSVTASTQFVVSDVRKTLLSAAKAVRKGSVVHLELGNSWMEVSTSKGRRMKVPVDMVGNTFGIHVGLPSGGAVATIAPTTAEDSMIAPVAEGA